MLMIVRETLQVREVYIDIGRPYTILAWHLLVKSVAIRRLAKIILFGT